MTCPFVTLSRVVVEHCFLNAIDVAALEDGKVAEEGTFEELMELGELFKELAERRTA